MLPFVVGGGILIALAFLIDGICVDMNALDVTERTNFGTITPIAAWFKSLGDTAFGFMLPVLAGFIAMAVGDRPALALGFVGGMLASGGKSGFLGALAAGFAAGYIIILLRKLCDKLPDFLEKIAPGFNLSAGRHTYDGAVNVIDCRACNGRIKHSAEQWIDEHGRNKQNCFGADFRRHDGD